LDLDAAVVVAYGLILPQAVLDAPRRGCLNIHASLLPRWRGAAPIHRAVMAGDAGDGRVHHADGGGARHRAGAAARGDCHRGDGHDGDLHDRLSEMGARLIAEALGRLDALVPERQPEEGVTYATKIDKAEARVDWTRPAAEVDRLIRGLSPFPGAWALAAGERVKLLRSRAVPVRASRGRCWAASPSPAARGPWRCWRCSAPGGGRCPPGRRCGAGALGRGWAEP
jgi:methionyl-tRNA formyltransferase